MMQNENWPVSGWRTAEPGEQGMNRELPQRLHSVITSDYANTNGIVVVRNGCIVCEEYFHGFGPDVPVHVASVTKSVLSAAKSGVDIRIITPHRWDKWWVHMTTRSYYRELIKSGVKIYEYTNGFIHSKTFVSDDRTATVGTTNLDFRSLYLHYECGALLYEAKAVMEVKEDFLQTLEICQQVTEKDCKTNIVVHLLQDILRLFAPLM